ncbi:hypothetical protein [Methanonatronarchaeum sp. AMET6-2]|uniref:hypothetical protein n=1 Tax=Methanonatronarchaeum sp. AMET6-2 TaxID=2933293 RepID=UPI0012262624|nr:hypothetical protein [Methanonatronarchaeum sp. AMET6-2]RZN62964.1 MAG: hypothetical protein EF811_01480 [Methanonatronarchaeia archaeon]UOY10737.1 hypothetical protein MU439_03610 [Methanonatronarchaeum sp. AMET6-2]
MTRLDSHKVGWVRNNIDVIDENLRRFVGLSFREICMGGGFFETDIHERDKSVSVVPLTAGEGEIPGFSRAVCDVLGYVGFDACVVDGDVAGLTSSVEGDYDGVLLADDEMFVGIDLDSRCVSNNNSSTARAYSIVIRKLAEKLDSPSCLLVGLGNIGGGILEYLFDSALSIGDFVDSFYVHDVDRGRVVSSVERWPVERFSMDEAGEVDIVVDATPSVSNLCYEDVFIENALYVIPGVPAGPYPEDRGFHDPLALGACTLAYMAFSGNQKTTSN